MSTTFKLFLHEQAKQHQAEANASKATVDEWRTAIAQLFNQFRAWLSESDSEGVIEIEETEQEVKEPGLGLYRVPRMDLRVFGKWIGIIPKARWTVGSAKPPHRSAPQQAEGRIDITDELRRYVLYRFRDGDHDLWLITPTEGGAEPKALDQDAFESALMSYLQ